MTGGYAPPSPAVNYRARVYGVSPRQSHLPSHLARRLAQGASTFTWCTLMCSMWLKAQIISDRDGRADSWRSKLFQGCFCQIVPTCIKHVKACRIYSELKCNFSLHELLSLLRAPMSFWAHHRTISHSNVTVRSLRSNQDYSNCRMTSQCYTTQWFQGQRALKAKLTIEYSLNTYLSGSASHMAIFRHLQCEPTSAPSVLLFYLLLPWGLCHFKTATFAGLRCVEVMLNFRDWG